MKQPRDIDALIQQGIEEARQGNRAAARKLLDNVVELDPRNEKALLWLASVVESDGERRAYLERVLEINPANDRALRALERINAQARATAPSDDAMPGVSRTQLRTILTIGAVVMVLLVVALIAIVIGNSSRMAAEASATRAVFAAQTATIEVGTQAVSATETAIAALPTATVPTATRTAIPTWTPTATVAPLLLATALPTPQSLTGTLVGWSGRDLQNIDYFPVGSFDLGSGRFNPVGSAVGREVDIRPGGGSLLFTQYNPSSFETLIHAMDFSGTPIELLPVEVGGWGVFDVQMPRYSPDGSRVAFVGTDAATTAPQVFMLNLQAQAGTEPIRRITQDGATYSYPSFSPEGNRLAVVRDGGSGPDIVVIDIATAEQTAVTTDLTTFAEMSPRWSPDGLQIVYSAAAANDRANGEISIRLADGSGTPLLPVRHPADDRYPVYSPDARYIAFSSNRGGQYDIYVYDLATQSLSQLTNTPEEDYPGGWAP